ncbi:MAG TPA: hypothetical protein VGL53_15965 [Bryobacteraceae bacterium]
MRRSLASLLVALFSFALISPAVFASDADDSLPACCRRVGEHHCGMMTPEAGSSTAPALRTARCPLFPKSTAATLSPDATSAACGIRTPIACVRSSVHAEPALLAYEGVYDPAAPKRGPPARF